LCREINCFVKALASLAKQGFSIYTINIEMPSDEGETGANSFWQGKPYLFSLL
jgi:hypothetical protein